MKPLFFFFGLVLIHFSSLAQGTLPESFFDGKAVVLVSAEPGALPAMNWRQVADSVHSALIKAGGDPVAYFELEQVSLSEEIQADFAKSFLQRQIKNIILVTRKKAGSSIHVGVFSGDGKVISSTALFGVNATDLFAAGDQFARLGNGRKSQNLLVIEVPEFPAFVGASGGKEPSGNTKFLSKNPLNLDVFKLGVPIQGSFGQNSFLSYFRFDIYGKSQEAILAEQTTQKLEIEQILKNEYVHQVEWMTTFKTTQQLIAEKVQFVLTKVEGREADLMKSMGLDTSELYDPSRNVVKYYIKFLVRDELYIGPTWDADPDWKKSLQNFLSNLSK
jgi:hypothetical protein